ncbi:hypothetical protein FF38_13408 [Lucilia cuprina]|uniref:Uncharacterized protein n=1 Tax=Lucilia cuprina TaxID=7375 RepID=A0A0L0CCK6_LUCCU|nr:hypothetical protein FF38_13408 [Lucilia cuprina]
MSQPEIDSKTKTKTNTIISTNANTNISDADDEASTNQSLGISNDGVGLPCSKNLAAPPICSSKYVANASNPPKDKDNASSNDSNFPEALTDTGISLATEVKDKSFPLLIGHMALVCCLTLINIVFQIYHLVKPTDVCTLAHSSFEIGHLSLAYG